MNPPRTVKVDTKLKILTVREVLLSVLNFRYVRFWHLYTLRFVTNVDFGCSLQYKLVVSNNNI